MVKRPAVVRLCWLDRTENHRRSASRGYTYRRTNRNLHVRGYKEEGTITTAFDMRVQNDLDRLSTQASRLGCSGGGFFSLFSGQNPQCTPLTQQIQQVRAALERTLADLDRLSSRDRFGNSSRYGFARLTVVATKVNLSIVKTGMRAIDRPTVLNHDSARNFAKSSPTEIELNRRGQSKDIRRGAAANLARRRSSIRRWSGVGPRGHWPGALLRV